MLILHTFENVYDEDHHYRQFAQRGPDPLEAVSLCGDPQTIRQFLEELHGELDLEDDAEQEEELRPDPPENPNADLKALIAAGDIRGFLTRAEELALEQSGTTAEHVCQTHFGEWTHDTVELLPPTLREQVSDVWDNADDYPRSDWQQEVGNGDTLRGYWSWVEHMRESNAVVTCKFCGNEAPEAASHLHQGTWVGDACCWDERLRTTE
jgi:hypothetical protein